MEDNLYPNAGAYRPRTLEERKRERKNEEAKTLQALPILSEIIERFSEKVAFYGSIDSIPEDIMTVPAELSVIVAANKLTKENLAAELDYLKGLVNEYTKS